MYSKSIKLFAEVKPVDKPTNRIHKFYVNIMHLVKKMHYYNCNLNPKIPFALNFKCFLYLIIIVEKQGKERERETLIFL